jgi:hypothetical protein
MGVGDGSSRNVSRQHDLVCLVFDTLRLSPFHLVKLYFASEPDPALVELQLELK